MKKKVLIFTVLTLMLSVFTAYGKVNVPKYIKVGLKYSSSALDIVDVASENNGFTLRSDKEESKVIGNIDNVKNLRISSYNGNGVNSFIVVEQAGFKSYEEVLNYCKISNYSCIPYYSNNIFYAVKDELYTYNDALFAKNESMKKNASSYIINPSDKRIKIYNKNTGLGLLIFSEDNGEAFGVSDKNNGTLSIDSNTSHRDIMEFKKINNKLNVILNITMQHYLYSVVSAEIGSSSPLEAQKAQAVCARTYAVKNLGKHKSQGFDICPTTHCQVYKGTSYERERTIRAVDETNNLIATYNGRPIEAVYFSHSGGRTANVEDVWGTPFPYLKSVDDPYCKDNNWEYKIDYNKLTNKLARYKLGEIVDIKITEKKPTGTVTKLTVTGTLGTKTFERENIRIALSLNSQHFDIPPVSETREALTENGRTNVSLSSALSANGIIDLGNNIKIIDGNNNLQTVTLIPGDVIKGQGTGHLVGFCQHGAMGFADAGWDFERILKHYYTGIEIEGN